MNHPRVELIVWLSIAALAFIVANLFLWHTSRALRQTKVTGSVAAKAGL